MSNNSKRKAEDNGGGVDDDGPDEVRAFNISILAARRLHSHSHTTHP